MHRLRKTLKEYYEALRAQARFLNQVSPNRRTCKNLQALFQSHRFDMAQMNSSSFLNGRYHGDLVANSWEEREFASKSMGMYLYRPFEEKRIATPRGEMRIFSDKRIRSVVRLLAIPVSSILLALSIVVLYFISSQTVRLGLVILFSTLYPAALAMLSDAKNSEIMAVTAAYAAVSVVFASGLN
ncbi:hypothetical protein BO94DRAFT_40116 [Aspergillus sclerotioniger CBS 115572]|uniref:DUF6594 domain-containing protein n=1 Tax=Aspergillus sclerotioniger CBS 115572 TaxID=1450535 RepID=A0A317WTY0_9EURO|nr:hypothetical protein BO94DRAFT_40116 [Aspergillus sclerotioniger CBS 115572]PWY89545.1 hypothetical protein BO94DRAFT_40116 [Aspergillus sclerotioniger CBS 115572]